MGFFSFLGTSKPLVNYNLFTNLDFLKYFFCLSKLLNYLFEGFWSYDVTSWSSGSQKHQPSLANTAEFPQRAFWTPEFPWRDFQPWVPKIVKSKSPPQKYGSIQPTEMKTIELTLQKWEVSSQQNSWEVGDKYDVLGKDLPWDVDDTEFIENWHHGYLVGGFNPSEKYSSN